MPQLSLARRAQTSVSEDSNAAKSQHANELAELQRQHSLELEQV